MNIYEAPVFEIQTVADADIICTSGGFDLPEIPLGGNIGLTAEDI